MLIVESRWGVNFLFESLYNKNVYESKMKELACIETNKLARFSAALIIVVQKAVQKIMCFDVISINIICLVY